MKNFVNASVAVALAAAMQSVTLAAPISVNGAIGSEWDGVTPVHVLHDDSVNANSQGPGNPGLNTDGASYDVYTRSDGTYLYVGLQSVGTTPAAGLFANLYFDTSPGTGSDVGFETGNNRAFIPGVPTGGVNNDGYYAYTTANDIYEAATPGANNGGTIEFAVPLTFFTTDPLAIGFPVATTAVQVRTSQSFGYSGNSGTAISGTRFGIVSVPEPTSLALVGLGAAGLLLRRRRAAR